MSHNKHGRRFCRKSSTRRWILIIFGFAESRQLNEGMYTPEIQLKMSRILFMRHSVEVSGKPVVCPRWQMFGAVVRRRGGGQMSVRLPEHVRCYAHTDGRTTRKHNAAGPIRRMVGGMKYIVVAFVARVGGVSSLYLCTTSAVVYIFSTMTVSSEMVS